MNKLTSKDIQWDEGMVCAVVCEVSQKQYEMMPEPCVMDGPSANKGFLFGNDKYCSKYFHVVNREQLAPKLVTLINIFQAEYPDGFQNLDGYSKDDFYNEVQALRDTAGVDKAIRYHISKKTALEPVQELKKAIVDAVNYYHGDLTGSNGDVITKHGKDCFSKVRAIVLGVTSEVVCNIEEFNQCVTYLTGNPAEHKAWLTALNDMRADDKREAKAKKLFEVHSEIYNKHIGGYPKYLTWGNIGKKAQAVYLDLVDTGIINL